LDAFYREKGAGKPGGNGVLAQKQGKKAGFLMDF
jgi:hypothetical protein